MLGKLQLRVLGWVSVRLRILSRNSPPSPTLFSFVPYIEWSMYVCIFRICKYGCAPRFRNSHRFYMSDECIYRCLYIKVAACLCAFDDQATRGAKQGSPFVGPSTPLRRRDPRETPALGMRTIKSSGSQTVAVLNQSTKLGVRGKRRWLWPRRWLCLVLCHVVSCGV